MDCRESTNSPVYRSCSPSSSCLVCFVLYCCVMWVVARSTRPFPWTGPWRSSVSSLLLSLVKLLRDRRA